MTTRIVASQISVPAANVGQYLVATANGFVDFGVVVSASGGSVSSARSVGLSMVFGL